MAFIGAERTKELEAKRGEMKALVFAIAKLMQDNDWSDEALDAIDQDLRTVATWATELATNRELDREDAAKAKGA